MNERVSLTALAKQVMKERGLEPVFSKKCQKQLTGLTQPSPFPKHYVDLRSLLWCSIDNEDSHDLDQLTYGEYENDKTIAWVAIADVDSLIHEDTPIDQHAKANTTSVYTPSIIFPMLPEKLSSGLTSLSENKDRLAIAIKMTIDDQGNILEHSIFHAVVHNYAKLTYHEVGVWLEKKGKIPSKIENITGLEDVLRLQHEVAKRLEKRRYQMGALSLEPTELRVKVSQDKIVLKYLVPNPAYRLIEHFMIAANFVIATHLKSFNISCLSRIVRQPKRWDRIVEIAKNLGFFKLDPDKPNPKALEDFLIERKKKDPASFNDLSLVILKLLGKGEYVAEPINQAPIGHFGLALKEYTHFTAPNRRFADLVTQRLLKSSLYQKKLSYNLEDLQWIAGHCTEMEDEAMKVERHLNKSAAALLLSDQLGKEFQAIVTGASEKGTWVKIFDPHIEGKVVEGSFKNWDVGAQVKVKLISVDVQKGFINFSSEANA